MKLVQLDSPNLLKGSWVWKTSDKLELEPIFSNVEEALRWYEKFMNKKMHNLKHGFFVEN